LIEVLDRINRTKYREADTTIGGVAMDLIDSYRNETKYPQGLTTCSGNSNKRSKEIQMWYK